MGLESGDGGLGRNRRPPRRRIRSAAACGTLNRLDAHDMCGALGCILRAWRGLAPRAVSWVEAFDDMRGREGSAGIPDRVGGRRIGPSTTLATPRTRRARAQTPLRMASKCRREGGMPQCLRDMLIRVVRPPPLMRKNRHPPDSDASCTKCRQSTGLAGDGEIAAGAGKMASTERTPSLRRIAGTPLMVYPSAIEQGAMPLKARYLSGGSSERPPTALEAALIWGNASPRKRRTCWADRSSSGHLAGWCGKRPGALVHQDATIQLGRSFHFGLVAAPLIAPLHHVRRLERPWKRGGVRSETSTPFSDCDDPFAPCRDLTKEPNDDNFTVLAPLERKSQISPRTDSTSCADFRCARANLWYTPRRGRPVSRSSGHPGSPPDYRLSQ